MSMVRRLLPLLLVLLFVAEDARASCAPPNPRAQVRYADAAFVGRFVSSRRDGDATWLKFSVERVLKGQLAATVEIHQRGVSSIHFSGFQPDERVGLTMNFENGAWLSNDCQRYDPGELADAFEPIPRPPGRGRAAFFVHAGFGSAGGAVLDRRGRVLAYSYSGSGTDVGVCPGGRRMVELSGSRIRLRSTRTLRVIESRSAGFTRRLHCLGRVVARATSSGLFRGDRRIWRGRWTRLDFHGRFAVAAVGDDLVRVDLLTGRARTLATLAPDHAPVGDLAISPDGRRLALFGAAKVAVVDIGTGRLRSTDLPEATNYWEVVWTGRKRFALTTFRSYRSPAPHRPARFYDLALDLLGEVPGWTAGPAVGAGGAIIGFVANRLERGTPEGSSVLGRLPGSWPMGIHRLPDVEIRASRRIPRY